MVNTTKIIDIWDKSVFETPKYVYAKFNNLIFLVISDSTNILYLEKYDPDFNNVFCISKKYTTIDEKEECYVINNIFKLIRISCSSGNFISEENKFVYNKIIKNAL